MIDPSLAFALALALPCAILAACSGEVQAPSSSLGQGGALAGGSPRIGGGNDNTAGTSATGVGVAGVGGAGGSGNAGGSDGPVDISVTPHAVSPGGAGKVFNVVDDFFDDGFVPPSPLANFGFSTPIIPFVYADGSLDVAWIDYTGGQGKVFGLDSSGMINITHIDASLATATTMATGIKSYVLLGFTADPSGNFYLAYNVDHPFKNAIPDDANNVNGNELHIAKSSGKSFASKAWDTLAFGDQDNTMDLSKGNPGAAGSGVLAFDSVSGMLALYVAHQMAWGDHGTRHQAGYFRLYDPATGQEIAPGGKAPLNTGAGWFYSHNFDQRLLVDNGIFYMLAQGDAFPRQLGFASWSVNGYGKKNSTDFDQPYFAIDGMEGDNQTNSETGQLVKLTSGQFAIVHTTSQGRTARDVRIVLASASTGAVASEAWLTNNSGTLQATMPKVQVLGPMLVVSYGLWDSKSRTNKKIDWYVMLLDQSLKPVTQPKNVPGVEFVAGSPAFQFSGGPNAGSVGWVSGNATHTLNVDVVSLSH